MPNRPSRDPPRRIFRAGVLDAWSRQDLSELAWDGPAARRLARHTNSPVLPDDDTSDSTIAGVVLVDDDTIRTGYSRNRKERIEGLARFVQAGSGRTAERPVADRSSNEIAAPAQRYRRIEPTRCMPSRR